MACARATCSYPARAQVPGSGVVPDQPERSALQRIEFCTLADKPAGALDALAAADDELHTALDDLKALPTKDAAEEVRLTDNGELIISPRAGR